MIPFFRKIRKKMADDNRPLKYARYAIGEIVLVVVGILIALQINTWNEDRKNRIYEKEYLIRLIEDLDHDQNDLSSVIISNSINLVLAEDALKKLGSDTSILSQGNASQLAHNAVTIKKKEVIFKDSLLSDHFELENFGQQLTMLTTARIFDLTQTTITDLISTGKIEVIRDKTLKKDIQNYYSSSLRQVGNEEDILTPHRRYLVSVFNDLGIPPRSKLSVSDVHDMIRNDQRLAMAIYNIYEANYTLLHINYARNKSIFRKIQKIKNEIKVALEKM